MAENELAPGNNDKAKLFNSFQMMAMKQTTMKPTCAVLWLVVVVGAGPDCAGLLGQHSLLLLGHPVRSTRWLPCCRWIAKPTYPGTELSVGSSPRSAPSPVAVDCHCWKYNGIQK